MKYFSGKDVTRDNVKLLGEGAPRNGNTISQFCLVFSSLCRAIETQMGRKLSSIRERERENDSRC